MTLDDLHNMYCPCVSVTSEHHPSDSVTASHYYKTPCHCVRITVEYSDER